MYVGTDEQGPIQSSLHLHVWLIWAQTKETIMKFSGKQKNLKSREAKLL